MAALVSPRIGVVGSMTSTTGKRSAAQNGKRMRNPNTGKMPRNTATNTRCCCNGGQAFEDCLTVAPIHCAKLTIADAVNCSSTANTETTGSINGEY